VRNVLVWTAKEGCEGKRPLPQRKSREAIIASLLADGILTEHDIAELVAQAAVDEARAIMRKQRQPPSTRKRAKPPPPPAAPPARPAPLAALPPAPPTPTAKERYRIRHWKGYNQALIQRGSLTIWLDQTTIQSWKNDTPNGLPGRDQTYTDTAILTLLTLKAVFQLALRATEGLTASILYLAQIALPIPDSSRLSRRSKTLSVPLPVQPRGD
jgi:hypothetical protein